MEQARKFSDIQTVVIAGGGVAGLLSALLLAREGKRVLVRERRPDFMGRSPFSGRSVNFTLSFRGRDVLRRAGILGSVLRHATPVRGRALHLRTGDVTFQPYGVNDHEVLHSIRRVDLHRALLIAACRSPLVEMQFEHALEGVDLGPGVAHFRKAIGDIETLGFDLFLGADGAFSRTQEVFCNQFRVERTREISDWKYIEFEIPAHDSAGHGLDPTCLHLWPRDDSLICAIPNNDGTFVANLIMRGELFAQLKGELRSRMFMGARFNDLLDLMGGRAPDFGSLKVSDIVTTAVAKWSFSGKAVLLGDACHAISPFLGQGMNAALEDAFLLVDCLRADGRSLSDSLKFFESSRKSDTDALARLSRLHLEDLRSNLGSPWKIAGARAELIMSRRFPRQIQPKYSLVAHSNLPYSVALRESGKTRLLAARITLACLQSCIFLSRSVAARPNRTDTNIKRGPV